MLSKIIWIDRRFCFDLLMTNFVGRVVSNLILIKVCHLLHISWKSKTIRHIHQCITAMKGWLNDLAGVQRLFEDFTPHIYELSSLIF
jgi:hypothetical protein